jgi:hypothetical protein
MMDTKNTFMIRLLQMPFIMLIKYGIWPLPGQMSRSQKGRPLVCKQPVFKSGLKLALWSPLINHNR